MNQQVLGPGFFIFFRRQWLGGDDAPTLIVYDELSKNSVKQLTKKIKRYKKKKKKIDPESVEAIVQSMVDIWEKDDIEAKMAKYDIDSERAIESYKLTLRELLNEELAIVFIILEM